MTIISYPSGHATKFVPVPRPPDRVDAADRDQLEMACTPVTTSVRSDGWPPLLPLTRADALPTFPAHALPWPLGEFVTGTARELQTPRAMIAAFVLGVLYAIMTGHVWVQIPRRRGLEPVCGWIAPISDPGTRKTPALHAARKPLDRLERRLAADGAERVSKYEAQRKLLENRVRLAEAACNAAPADTTAAANYEAARVALDALKPEIVPRLTVGNATIEALFKIMHEQGGRISVVADEDSLFAMCLGKYAKGPNVIAPIADLLSAWSGARVDLHRLGRGSFVIEHAALSWCVGAQPALFHAVQDASTLQARGFFDRWSFVICPSFVGRRDTEPEPMPDGVVNAYAETVVALGGVLHAVKETVLVVAPAAIELVRPWRRKWERRMGAAGDLRAIVGWASKADSHLWRLAAVFQLVIAGLEQPIGTDAVERALVVVEHLAAHQLAAVDMLALDPIMRCARELAAWMRDAEDKFTTRDAKKHMLKGWRDEALTVLLDHGYIRKRVSAEKRPGRPSEVWEVNPAARSFGRSGSGSKGDLEALSLSPENVLRTPSELLPELPEPAPHNASDLPAAPPISPKPAAQDGTEVAL